MLNAVDLKKLNARNKAGWKADGAPLALFRPLTIEGMARAREIAVSDLRGKREWAPIRKRSEWTPKPEMPIVAADPSAPVKVQLKVPRQAGSTLLAEYANMADFDANHSRKDYPIKGQPASLDGVTIVLVTAAIWIAKGKEPTTSKREGPPKSTVRVRGMGNKVINPEKEATTYRSVLVAFTELKLDVKRHQKFRAELKKVGKLTYTEAGKGYEFEVVS